MSKKNQKAIEKRMIIYKKDYATDRVVLRPDTFYWRARYWFNQYLALLLALIIKPVVRFNYEFWRIKEGEKFVSMELIHRIGMRIRDPDPFTMIIVLPPWIRKSKRLLKKAFEYFRDL